MLTFTCIALPPVVSTERQKSESKGSRASARGRLPQRPTAEDYGHYPLIVAPAGRPRRQASPPSLVLLESGGKPETTTTTARARPPGPVYQSLISDFLPLKRQESDFSCLRRQRSRGTHTLPSTILSPIACPWASKAGRRAPVLSSYMPISMTYSPPGASGLTRIW
jgi:hypothetical protein